MRNKDVNLYIISFPKCGRTWLRVMMAKFLSLHYKIPLEGKDIIWINNLSRYSEVPNIHFTHDIVNSRNPFVNDVSPDKYKNTPLVHLYRDPRDVLVSLFYHRQKRHPEEFEQFSRIKEFVHKSSAKHDIVNFFNRWANLRDYYDNMISINYEQLHLNAQHVLKSIFGLLEMNNISDHNIKRSIEFGEFPNMRKIEKNQEVDDITLKPTKPNDYTTYKTRKGVKGGYIDDLDDDDISYLSDFFNQKLDKMYLFYFS